MKKLTLIIYLIAIAIIDLIMCNLGCGINTWKWWSVVVCTWISYICGYIDGKKNIGDDVSKEV